MAKKMIAVFLVCIVVVAALQFSSANNVEEKEAKFDARFKSCFNTCEKECLANGKGQSFCEVKCDEDCDEKEVADKLNIKLPQ